MSDVIRLSISLEKGLAGRLERLRKASGHTNRSEYIRDLIRRRLVEQEWADQHREVVGTITLIYDHHQRQLTDSLLDAQHDHHDQIMATTHVHIAHDRCAEMIMVRGPAGTVRALAERLRRLRGVLHAELSMSTTAAALR